MLSHTTQTQPPKDSTYATHTPANDALFTQPPKQDMKLVEGVETVELPEILAKQNAAKKWMQFW